MSEAVVPVPAGFDARIGPAELAALHEAFARDADAFWLDQARRPRMIFTSAGTPMGRSTCRSTASTAISRPKATRPR
jgi:hypothetical protein